MADEYVQDSSGGTIGGVVGQNVAWMAYHRTRQQTFAYKNGPLTPRNYYKGRGYGNKMYGIRTWTGYTSTLDELAAWNTGQGMRFASNGGKFLGMNVPKFDFGSPIAAATRTATTPLLGAQMIRNPGAVHSTTAFHGTGISVAAGAMDAEKIGVWAADRMLKSGGGIATAGPKGWYNQGLYKFLGGQVDNVAGKAASVTAKEGLEVVARIGAQKAGLKFAGTAASRAVGYAVPILGEALMAYDIAMLSYYGFTGVAKLGEAIHYKIPKAYFQNSMKSYMRGRFEGIGPASVMTGENMNNRMRAVQAIQGSRLNARSALGNEAGLLAGHFG